MASCCLFQINWEKNVLSYNILKWNMITYIKKIHIYSQFFILPVNQRKRRNKWTSTSFVRRRLRTSRCDRVFNQIRSRRKCKYLIYFTGSFRVVKDAVLNTNRFFLSKMKNRCLKLYWKYQMYRTSFYSFTFFEIDYFERWSRYCLLSVLRARKEHSTQDTYTSVQE